MNQNLGQLFRNRLKTGLQRQSIQSCSQWAELYRVMGPPFPGPYSFLHHPWTREAHDCPAELLVCKKAAQTGFTEAALNRAFYTIDILGSNVLYYLPTSTPDATNFSAARFDPALDMSPHLQNLFSDVRNVGHKRAGNASLFIRGARSRSQAKSVPASEMIFDELDEMNPEIVVLARERTSGQNIAREMMLSTPTIEDHGIDVYWQQSSMDKYFFKCPHCGKFDYLRFPESLVITAEKENDPRLEESHLICTHCKGVLDNEEKPIWLAESNCQWVPEVSDAPVRGLGVNQLYSMAYRARPAVIAGKVIRASNDPVEEQELYNSKLGECHTVDGAKVLESDVKDAIGGSSKIDRVTRPGWYTMGVDVGPKWLYVEITEYLRTSNKKIVYDYSNSTIAQVIQECKVEQFEELDDLMRKFRITHCVIDAQPEARKAMEFAQRFFGIVSLCFYADATATKFIREDREKMTISVGRTPWLDSSLMRFKRGTIRLPADISLDYKNHMQALTRIYEKDSQGNPTGRYVCGSKQDHFAHARNYSEIALELALKGGSSQDMDKI